MTAECCRDLGGNAQALVAHLREGKLSHFRVQNADDLEAYLIEQGYISPEQPLEDDAIWSRVIDRVTTHDLAPDDSIQYTRSMLDRIHKNAFAMPQASA